MARFEAAGYDGRHVCEIILAFAVKAPSNRATRIRRTALDDVFAEFRWEPEAA